MECTSEICKRKLRKRLHIINGSFNVTSESSLSSESESRIHPFLSLSRKRKKASCHSKRDYLSRLFERKKLKDKSLSKKLRTPFDRKINRTCWPIELKKVSKIKKKPREKRREKPTHRSLTRRKFPDPIFVSGFRENSPQFTCSELDFLDEDTFGVRVNFSNPMFISSYRGNSPQLFCKDLEYSDDNSFKFRRKFSNPRFFSRYRAGSPRITCSELEFLNDDSFNVVYQYLNKKDELITPEMLIDVLRRPEYSKTGATINAIMREFRNPNLDMNAAQHQLREEISVKLLWAVKLGIIVEDKGYYKVADSFRNGTSSKQKVNLLWDWWFRRMKKIRI